MKKFTTKQIVASGLIAAIYAAVTLSTAGMSFGPTQIRVAESMALLPLILPEAIPGLFVGCFLSNTIAGYGIADAIFGSMTTLFAAYLTSKCKNAVVGGLPPVILNGLVIGLMLKLLGVSEGPLPVIIVLIAVEEAASVYILGLPLYSLLRKLINSDSEVM